MQRLHPEDFSAECELDRRQGLAQRRKVTPRMRNGKGTERCQPANGGSRYESAWQIAQWIFGTSHLNLSPLYAFVNIVSSCEIQPAHQRALT
jgi:hypothetical protein